MLAQSVLPVNLAPRTGGWDQANALELAAQWGKEDAMANHDQQGGAYFPIGSPAWHAYNDGFAAGCLLYTAMTGKPKHYWLPQAPQCVSWNAKAVV